MKVILIVACGKNGEIGIKGNLPWKIKEDMARFKNITMDHHVMMGRKTYESIPPRYRPLTGRTCIIVSRDPDRKDLGCLNVTSIEEGIELAKSNGEKELYVAGGGEIYAASLDIADEAYMTLIEEVYVDADAFFPLIHPEFSKTKDAVNWIVTEEIAGMEAGYKFSNIKHVVMNCKECDHPLSPCCKIENYDIYECPICSHPN